MYSEGYFWAVRKWDRLRVIVWIARDPERRWRVECLPAATGEITLEDFTILGGVASPVAPGGLTDDGID